MGAAHDRSAETQEGLRPHRRGRRDRLPGQAGPHDRVPRAERRRQVDGDADDPRSRPADLGHGDGGRTPIPGHGVAAARGWCAAGRARGAPGPVRLQPPVRTGRGQRHRPRARRRGARSGRAHVGGAQAGRRVLAGHVAAARDRRGAARRPGDAVVRRAGQRPRPGRDPVDQDSHALAGRRGPHGAGLEPLDERDGADRGPFAGDRQGTAARGHAAAGADRPELRRAGRGPRGRPATAGGGPARGRSAGHDGAGRDAERVRARVEADRRARRRVRPRAAPAAGCDRLARGGLLPADRRERRVPGPQPGPGGGMSAHAGTAPRTSASLETRLRATARSEWIKFRSVRSGPAVLLATAVILPVTAWLLCSYYRNSWATMSPASKASFDPVFISLRGIEGAQLFVGALGVITATGEYTSGLIRGTFIATPQRAQVIAMKAMIFAAIVWAWCTLLSFGAFFIGQALLSSPAKHVAIGDPGVLTAVFGGGLYLTLVGLLGLFIGVLLRRTPAALAALFGILLVLPVAVGLLGGKIGAQLAEFLPDSGGEEIFKLLHGGAYTLGPGQGFAVLAAYVAAAAAPAFLLVRRRNA